MFRLFDLLNERWEQGPTPRYVSTILIISFVSTLIIIGLQDYFGIFSAVETSGNYFLAIDVAFSILLIFEILGLIFILPRSVADSVGKQFEILSIVLLRSAFKEFGYLFHAGVDGSMMDLKELGPLLSDAFGALIIFFIIGIYYKKQKHERITEGDAARARFINFKKAIAILLLISYVGLGVTDLMSFASEGNFESSLNTFYLILIFSDILILLYSLRFHSRYINLFRYSSFAFATILIRLALSAPDYLNAIAGIVAGLFVLGLTFAYNYYRNLEDSKRTK